jgi:hypothetical protein
MNYDSVYTNQYHYNGENDDDDGTDSASIVNEDAYNEDRLKVIPVLIRSQILSKEC